MSGYTPPPRQLMLLLGMVLASYWIDAAFLGLFWWAGAMAGDAALIAAVGGTLTCTAFLFAFHRRWNERFSDRFLSIAQLAAGSVVLAVIALRVPEARLMVLLMLFIGIAFAALGLSARQLLVAWAVTAAGIVLIVESSAHPLALPRATLAQGLLSALWLAAALGRCAVVGLYGSSLRHRLGRRTRQLAEATGRLELLASRDGLTGALNRRAVMQVLHDALDGADGPSPSTAVALIDVDHFKAVNDRFGHAVGDEVLHRFVVATQGCLRATDRLGRYGGEEFLVVLPLTPSAEAASPIAQRIREATAARDWSDVAPGLWVTVSVGVAIARPGESPAGVVARADRALYRAKSDGRNLVRLAP